jgi:hypothetical protein
MELLTKQCSATSQNTRIKVYSCPNIRNQDTKTCNTCGENVAKFKYLGTTKKKQENFKEKLKAD